MKVADLIYLLQPPDSAATVLLGAIARYEGRASRLGVGEVQPPQLGERESVGLVLLEPWVNGGDDLHGPFSGVVHGSKEQCQTQS